MYAKYIAMRHTSGDRNFCDTALSERELFMKMCVILYNLYLYVLDLNRFLSQTPDKDIKKD